MRHALRPLVLVLLLAAACAAPPEETPFQPVAGNKLLMTSVIEPAADGLWDAVGTVISVEGVEELRPASDEEWAAVRNAAVTVAESGNLLMMGRRAVDQEEWIDWSRAMIDAGVVALEAADAQDADALFDAGGQLYESCQGCHRIYWPQGNFDPPPG